MVKEDYFLDSNAEHSAATLDIDQTCDICDNAFSEGNQTYVGMVADGKLVNVSDCCKVSLNRLFSQSVYTDKPSNRSREERTLF